LKSLTKYRNSLRGGRIASIILPVLLLGALLLFGIFLFIRMTRLPSLNQTQQKIIDTLTAGGMSQRAALFWCAVSMFETGNYTSNVFKLSNNCFGMKVPKYRRSSRSGIFQASDGQVYSAYSSIEDSALDILYYCKDQNYPMDFQDVSFLVHYMKTKDYFEISESVYLAGVQSMLNRLL